MIGAVPVLVTGGAGFIGSHIVDALITKGHAVAVIDDLSTGNRSSVSAAATLEILDLASPEAGEAVARLRPAVIVHCAAQVSVPASLRDPAADVRANVIGSLNVITGGLAAETTRFVYVTTGGALYGQPIETPCTETHPIAPLSPYGWTKYMVERYLEFMRSATMPWVALRLANVYGPRQRADGEGGVVARFADAMARGLPITIDGDGGQTRDFVYVADVVNAVEAAIDSEATGPINIGTARGTSVNELFGVLASISGYDRPPAYGAPRLGDIYTSVLACERARVELDWSAQTTLESGLRKTFAALTS